MVMGFDSRKMKHLKSLERLNPPRSARSWGRYINEAYDGRCVVTGISNLEGETQVHHLVSNYLMETNPVSHKERVALKFSLLNGVVLEKSLHKKFHTEYGNKVTPLMLVAFLNNLERDGFIPNKQRIQEAKSWILCLHRELTFLYPVVRSLKI